MRVHQDWTSEMFDAEPIAPHVGPFASSGFLAAWHRILGANTRPALVEHDGGLLPMMHTGEALEFAGAGDVTDYHTPRGSGIPELLATYLDGLDRATRFRFDSLPREAAEVVGKAIELTGCAAEAVQHDVAPVLSLPGTYDDYLAALHKKDRHEMRRKRRRFEAALGPPRLERREGPEAIADFARMHRRSAGEKGSFMDETHEAFFLALHRGAGAVVDVLVAGAGKAHAMSFGFEEPGAFYLYNTTYEPEDREHSPGVVLLEMLIRRALGAGRTRFDLLKGDEAYKYRLGAEARPLYLIEGVTGGKA